MSFLESREAFAPSGIGRWVPRREDARLLTGSGRYAADFNLPDQVFAYVLRSPHAHAKIVAIDPAPATGAPGVLAVLIGTDAVADGIGPIPHSPVPTNPHEVPLESPKGSPFFIAPHPVLAVDVVRYVGEPVAIVIAETLSQAMDAAERVQVNYQPVPAVVRSGAALAPGAPLVWAQHGSNLCVDTGAGDQQRTDAAFAQAAHVVKLRTTINRVTGVPMELRAVLGSYDPATDKFTVHTSAGGGVIRQRDDIAGALGAKRAGAAAIAASASPCRSS
jgi:carbon-monoxide dehydrogenase large subunit